ncbi:MAG: DinB family protein, partial [Isosphaerales bacterium]
MARPDSIEYAPYYAKYVSLVPEDDILTAMKSDLSATLSFLRSVPESEACLRHPPYTWSVKEVVGHLTDSERIFGYRALRFARDDSTPLPGFDENAYARAAEFDRQPFSDLVAEFEAVRRSHLPMNSPRWSTRGGANSPQAPGISHGCERSWFFSVFRSHRSVVRWRQPRSTLLPDGRSQGCHQL